MPFDAVMERLEDLSRFDYPVAEQDIYTLVGSAPKKVPGHVAIVRQDTDKVLAVHRGAYRLTPHREVLAPTIDILRSQLDLSGATVKDHVFGDGSRIMRELFLPAYRVEVGGHAIDFRIRQLNSYDGSTAYQMDAGAWRLICSNGARIGTFVSATYQKHTTKIDAAAEAGKLAKALEFFRDETGTWKLWYNERVRDDAVHNLFSKTLAASPSRAEPDGVNKRQLEVLMGEWDRNRNLMGTTRWAVFNTATWWASHGEGRSRSAAQISLEREAKVQAMTQTRLWRELAA